MWGKNDPVHFGNLQISMVSLFRAVTLEDWTDLMYTQMFGCDNYGYDSMQHLCTESTAAPVMGSLFFVSFVLVGTMIILNLFIGVIMKGMDEAQSEMNAQAEEDQDPLAPVQADAAAMAKQLKVLQHHLAEAQKHLAALQAPVASKEDEVPEAPVSMPEPLPAE
jgi:voltage-gated sodium channel